VDKTENPGSVPVPIDATNPEVAPWHPQTAPVTQRCGKGVKNCAPFLALGQGLPFGHRPGMAAVVAVAYKELPQRHGNI
jgi:hypothetical protein